MLFSVIEIYEDNPSRRNDVYDFKPYKTLMIMIQLTKNKDRAAYI